MIQSDVNENDAAVNFSQSTVLGLSNPLNFPGLTNDWKVSVLVMHVRNHNTILYACRVLNYMYWSVTGIVQVLVNQLVLFVLMLHNL